MNFLAVSHIRPHTNTAASIKKKFFFKKAYEQLVEEHFSPQLMFRPAVLAQCLTWDHMQSCLEVCMLLCLIRSV